VALPICTSPFHRRYQRWTLCTSFRNRWLSPRLPKGFALTAFLFFRILMRSRNLLQTVEFLFFLLTLSPSFSLSAYLLSGIAGRMRPLPPFDFGRSCTPLPLSRWALFPLNGPCSAAISPPPRSLSFSLCPCLVPSERPLYPLRVSPFLFFGCAFPPKNASSPILFQMFLFHRWTLVIEGDNADPSVFPLRIFLLARSDFPHENNSNLLGPTPFRFTTKLQPTTILSLAPRKPPLSTRLSPSDPP